MKVKTALDSMVQWSIKRLGVPGTQTSLPKRIVSCPSAQIPLSIEHPRVRRWIASVRYPITYYRDNDVNHLWQAYETTVDRFGNPDKLDTCEGNIGGYLIKQLQLPAKTAEYLYGHGAETNQIQLEVFAVMTARIAHEIFGCPLINEPGTYAAKIGAKPGFGIHDGRLVSRFNSRIEVQTARPIMKLEEITKGRVAVAAPAVLNLYQRAEEAGDEATVYFLDCGIWLSQRRATTLHKSLYNYIAIKKAMASAKKETLGAIRKDRVKVDKFDKIPLSSSIYQQGKFIIEHAEDPRLALQRLLVPHIIPYRTYQLNFGNPYVKTKMTDLASRRLHNALDELFKSSIEGPGFDDDNIST